MSFLTVMQSVAKNAGVDTPSTTGSNEPDQVKLAQFINEAGQELVRRVDWGPLRKVTTLTGTGAASEYSLPADFDRFPMGVSIMAGANSIRGSLTSDEWFSLPSAKGEPRYYYLSGSKIAFYPYPALNAEVRLQYQSKNWVNAGAKAVLNIDTDAAMISEDLISMGAIWRWRRHTGKDFADHLAEFEAAIGDKARFDSGVRQP